jgi:hypothetical protein
MLGYIELDLFGLNVLNSVRGAQLTRWNVMDCEWM